MPRLTSGRQLKEAPRWPDSDGALFFDVTSGDYWVLAPDAASVLRQVIGGATTDDATFTTLDALVAAGLLEQHAEQPA